jgi:uncharacterized phage protein (TIGR01671 family)
MREIRFRAWDSKDKKLRMVEEISFLSTHDDYENEGGLPYSVQVDATDKADPNHFITLAPDRFILQQFTGLHDKNGKGIYEGDIYQQIGSTAIGIVEWSTVRAGFLVDCRWNKNRAGKVERRADSFETPLHNDGKIIGNVYENPELLK